MPPKNIPWMSWTKNLMKHSSFKLDLVSDLMREIMNEVKAKRGKKTRKLKL